MDNNFDKCLAFVLKEEGGNDDDPNDHGGRTSRGITQREWDKFRITHPDRPGDVWQASDEDIKTIYHDEYWLPECPKLDAGLDLEFFDFKINAGPKQAIKTLQRVLGVNVDGVWGSQTEGALPGKLISTLVSNYSDTRESFYRSLAQFSRFGKGWLGRNARCEHLALSMISVTPASPRANPADVKVNTTHGPATGVVIVTAGTVVAAQYHSPLIFLGVLGVALAVGLTVHYFVNRKIIQ